MSTFLFIYLKTQVSQATKFILLEKVLSTSIFNKAYQQLYSHSPRNIENTSKSIYFPPTNSASLEIPSFLKFSFNGMAWLLTLATAAFISILCSPKD